MTFPVSFIISGKRMIIFFSRKRFLFLNFANNFEQLINIFVTLYRKFVVFLKLSGKNKFKHQARPLIHLR